MGFYPARLDYGCSRPLTKALSTLSRWRAARIAALDLKRRFGALGLWWLNHDASPVCHANRRPQVLPSYCTECLREQALREEPAHLRAEWALAFLTHRPQHRACCGFVAPLPGAGHDGLGAGGGGPAAHERLPSLRPPVRDRVFRALVAAAGRGAGVRGRLAISQAAAATRVPHAMGLRQSGDCAMLPYTSDQTSSLLEAATRLYQKPESLIVRFWLRKSV